MLKGHDAAPLENSRTPKQSLGTIMWRESLQVFTPQEKETDEPVRPCPGAMAPPVAVFSWLPDMFALRSGCVLPFRAPLARSTGCRLRPPTVGYGRGTELAQPLASFEFSGM